MGHLLRKRRERIFARAAAAGECRCPALSESAIQRAVFAHIRTRGAPDTFAFHPRNEGRDQRHLAGINTGLGVRPGLPDVIIIKGGICFALELKTEAGKLSREQTDVLIEMRRAGCDVGFAHGLDAALRWLEERKILRGRAG